MEEVDLSLFFSRGVWRLGEGTNYAAAEENGRNGMESNGMEWNRPQGEKRRRGGWAKQRNEMKPVED